MARVGKHEMDGWIDRQAKGLARTVIRAVGMAIRIADAIPIRKVPPTSVLRKRSDHWNTLRVLTVCGWAMANEAACGAERRGDEKTRMIEERSIARRIDGLIALSGGVIERWRALAVCRFDTLPLLPLRFRLFGFVVWLPSSSAGCCCGLW